MKKYFILLAFFVIIITSWYWWSSSKQNIKSLSAFNERPLRIIALGDSLVEGVGSTPGQDFVSLLEKQSGHSITNHGVSGDTSSDVLKRLDPLLKESPHVVILLVGGNDALRKLPKETTFTNIHTIVQRFQEKGSVVILIGVQGGLIGSGYQKEFNRVAKETESLYVPDILDGLIGDSRLMSDAVHPNNAGYAIIAERVYATLEPYLSQ